MINHVQTLSCPEALLVVNMVHQVPILQAQEGHNPGSRLN